MSSLYSKKCTPGLLRSPAAGVAQATLPQNMPKNGGFRPILLSQRRPAAPYNGYGRVCALSLVVGGEPLVRSGFCCVAFRKKEDYLSAEFVRLGFQEKGGLFIKSFATPDCGGRMALAVPVF